jgi:hypothetical protein
MNTLAAVLPLAAKDPSPLDVNPLWSWFGIFVFLAVATVLLWLSLRKQLKKIDFEVEPDPPKQREQPGNGARPSRS